MPLKSDAIIALNSDVAVVEEHDDGTVIAYDNAEPRNVVSYDESAVTAKLSELQSSFDLDELRGARNKMLIDTDSWALPDTPDMTQAQLDYRQALRDITDTYTSLDTVVWPTKP